MAVALRCVVQDFWSIGELKKMLWTNDTEGFGVIAYIAAVPMGPFY